MMMRRVEAHVENDVRRTTAGFYHQQSELQSALVVRPLAAALRHRGVL